MSYRYNNINAKGKLQINAAVTFADSYNHFCKSQKDKSPDFELLLQHCEKLVRSENSAVDSSAFNNTRGTWYQWLIALSWKKYTQLHQDEKRVLIKLPNKKSLKWHRLYQAHIQSLIDDLEYKISKFRITLETSNPDFILIDSGINVSEYLVPINEKSLADIDSEFKQFEGNIPFESMLCFISIKTSLRPDRRLQTQHEATMIKALNAYISTRNWDMSNLRIKFVVLVNSAPSDEDINSLSAIAAHSLVTPLVVPQKSVDVLTMVNDEQSAFQTFQQI